MSATLQNAAKRGDVNIIKKAVRDHYHAQTENETQKSKHQTFLQEHKRSKNGKKTRKPMKASRQESANIKKGGNEQVCGGNTIMQTPKTLQNLVQAGKYA